MITNISARAIANFLVSTTMVKPDDDVSKSFKLLDCSSLPQAQTMVESINIPPRWLRFFRLLGLRDLRIL